MTLLSSHPVELAIQKAAKESQRQRDDICLIAVSKTFPSASIEPFLEAGHLHFGENRLQEAQEKWPALKEKFSAVQLHLLGHLQTNKARTALMLFDYIHSLDRPKLAQHLARLMEETNKRPRCFVQVNIGDEPQKSGILLKEADDFIDFCTKELALPIIGVMALPPADENPVPYFGLLRKIAERKGLADLSMGMSDDFEHAIALGATHVRIGSALFGKRTSQAASHQE